MSLRFVATREPPNFHWMYICAKLLSQRLSGTRRWQPLAALDEAMNVFHLAFPQNFLIISFMRDLHTTIKLLGLEQSGVYSGAVFSLTSIFSLFTIPVRGVYSSVSFFVRRRLASVEGFFWRESSGEFSLRSLDVIPAGGGCVGEDGVERNFCKYHL